MTINATLLAKGLVALGMEEKGYLFDCLLQYLQLLEQYNPTLSLVKAQGDELIIKHILDSLAGLPFISSKLSDNKTTCTIADVGSGAGLPGIPLALAMPQHSFTLIDRKTKRIIFLQEIIQKLQIPNVRVMENQVERVKERYTLIVFRAFKPLDIALYKKISSLCVQDGWIIAYKGKQEKAMQELQSIQGMYAKMNISTIKVPFMNADRCIVSLQTMHKGS